MITVIIQQKMFMYMFIRRADHLATMRSGMVLSVQNAEQHGKWIC